MEQYPDSYYVASLNKDKESLPSLNDEMSCDLCVIGGGFTGLSTAIEAAKSLNKERGNMRKTKQMK